MPDFNVFFRHHATYPYLLRRHLVPDPDAALGPDPEARPDAWFEQVAKAVYQPDVYRQAAEALIAEGKLKASDFPTLPASRAIAAPGCFIDGLIYDGRHPNAYLQQFAIGLKGDERVQ